MKLFGLLISFLFPALLSAQADSLDNYINRLKQSKLNGGGETAFLSLGSDFLYAQEYFETGNFSSAEYSFRSIVRSNPDHPYANYQLAVSLLRQNDAHKTKNAEEFLQKAFAKIPSLKARHERDFPGKPTPAGTTKTGKGSEIKETADGLDAYIERIKYSRETSGKETEMLSAGLEAFYAIEYYEAGEYRSAETGFSLSLAKDPSNPYVNYLKAVSLAAQGKNNEAKPFLDLAVKEDATLKNRYTSDVAKARSIYTKQQAKNIVKSSPAATVKYGGKLVYGNYTCHQSVWNGPNAAIAYSQKYHGYFQLRSDGTYRWLDDGATGKYKYDEKTGTITWLSGYFKSASPKQTRYRTDPRVPQVTITYSENYRWECGCKK